MSARRALLIAQSSVPCCACSSTSSRVLAIPRRSNGFYRRYSSPRKIGEIGSASSIKRPQPSSIGRVNTIPDLPVPKSIAAHLDEYVIGQDLAKRALAVGVFNHYLRAASNSSSSSSVSVEKEYSQPVLYADRRKGKKTARSKDKDEEDILTDYVGQTKGSKRWNDKIEMGEKGSDLPFTEGSYPLTSDFFSSLRPEEGENKAEARFLSKNDRLMHSTSKIITTQSQAPLPPKAKTTPPPSLPPQMDKSNMILIGPSGSGKTHLVRTLSTFLSVPFVHIDATPLTSAGYVGEDVESIMSRLLEAADWNVTAAERGIVCIDEVDKLASPASSTASGTIKTAGRDVGGTGVQQALLRLLEGSIVSVPDKRSGNQASSSQAAVSTRFGGGRAQPGESKPWWSPEMQSINAEHGRAAQAMKVGGGSEIISDGKRRAGLTPGSDGTGTLKIDTSKVLFILCGAFVGLQDVIAARGGTRLDEVEAEDLTGYGLIPEFVGRLPVIVTLKDLTEKDLGRILTEPKDALVSQYQSLFAASGIELHFTTPAIASLAHQAAQSSKTSSGARVLRRLMEKRLLDAMFDAPNGGASYALMDESAAQGRTQVQLYSRGGKAAYLNAIEDEEVKHKKAQLVIEKSKSKKETIERTLSDAKVRSSSLVNVRQPTKSGSVSSPSILSRIDEANLRRRARARLTRPSRVGNLRILTSDG